MLEYADDDRVLQIAIATRGHHDWRTFVADAQEGIRVIAGRDDGPADDIDVRYIKRVRVALRTCGNIASAFVEYRPPKTPRTHWIDMAVAGASKQLDTVLGRVETLQRIFEDDDA